MSLAFKYSFDAYCVDFTRPHQNMATRSDKGGDSKSYVWGVLSNHIRINGTTETVTYATVKSGATDDVEMNDQIIIFDEIGKFYYV